jgi:hypothetical protein
MRLRLLRRWRSRAGTVCIAKYLADKQGHDTSSRRYPGQDRGGAVGCSDEAVVLTGRYDTANDDVSQDPRTEVGPVPGRRPGQRSGLRHCYAAGCC